MSTYNTDRPNSPQTLTVTFIRRQAIDTNPDLSWLMQEYTDETDEERATYKAQDKKRLDAYNAGEWSMQRIYVVAEISVPIGGNSFTCYRIESAGLYGVESDSEASYHEEVWTEQEDDLKTALKAMAPVFATL
jgi:hypothetical protein